MGIAEACSGIRSLWVLAAAAVAILHFGQFTRRRALVLLASVPVLAVAGNLVRLYVSALFISRGQHELAEGSAHGLLGLISFALALAGLIGVSRLLAAQTDRPTPPPPPEAAAPSRTPLLLIAAILLVATGLRAAVTAHYATPSAEAEFLAGAERLPLADLPEQIGDFRLLDTSRFVEEELEELRPSDHTIALYANERGQRIEAQLSYWQPQSLASRGAFRHPHWPDTCYPSQGWTRIPRLDAEKTYDWLPGETPRLRGFRRSLGDNREAVVVLAAWRSRADPPPPLHPLPMGRAPAGTRGFLAAQEATGALPVRRHPPRVSRPGHAHP